MMHGHKSQKFIIVTWMDDQKIFDGFPGVNKFL